MGILKDLKEAVSNTVPAAKTEDIIPAVEPAKSIEQITVESANKFPASQGTPAAETPTPTRQRKQRSDAGQPRLNRRMGARADKDSQMASSENGQAVAFTIDKQIVEKTAATVLHTIDGVIVKKVGSTVIRLGGDMEQANEFAKSAGLTTAEISLMSELTGIIFEKHGLLTGYAPEILLTILIAEYGVRVSITMRKLNLMVEEAEKKTKARPVE